MEAAVSANGSEVDNITQQLDATQLDADEQWEGALDVVFRGVRKYGLQFSA